MTSTGLQVRAYLDPGVYPTGESVPYAEMTALNLDRHEVCPRWNYTIRPRSLAASPTPPPAGTPEVNS